MSPIDESGADLATVDDLAMIRALRMSGDEVQLNRVLWTLCDDPAVARALCESILRNVTGRELRLPSPPGDVRSVQHRVRRGRLRRHRLRRLGGDGDSYVDLEFEGDEDWRLQVEIKVDSGFGKSQLERYGEHGPLAVIVRDATTAPTPQDKVNWVGAVSWPDLVPSLRDLPVDEPARRDWLRLLRVLEEDGDLGLERLPSAEVQQIHALLENLAAPLLERFKKSLRARYPRHRSLTDEIPVFPPKPSERRGGRLRVGFGQYEWLTSLRIVDLWRRTPQMQVRLYAGTPKRRDPAAFRGDGRGDGGTRLGPCRFAGAPSRPARVRPRRRRGLRAAGPRAPHGCPRRPGRRASLRLQDRLQEEEDD